MLLPLLTKRVTVKVTGAALAPSRRPSYQTRNAQMTVRVQNLIAHGRSSEAALRTRADTRRNVPVKAGARRSRSRLANVAVPLGIAAAIVSSQWWAVLPFSICAWWWAPRESGWEWAMAVGRGLIGAEWALVGSYALAAFPHERAVVGAAWVLAAVLLAASAKLAR